MSSVVVENMNYRGMFGKHFDPRGNINIYSLDAKHFFIKDFIEKEYIVRDEVEGLLFNDEWTRPLREFVVENHGKLLTSKQLEYVGHIVGGNYKMYTDVARSQYRMRMGKRITRHICGMEVRYYNRMDTDLRNLRLINQLIDVSDDLHELSAKVVQLIDEPLLNELVYEMLDDEARQSVVEAVLTGEPVSSKALYKLFNMLYEEYDLIHARFAHNRCTRK